MKRLVLVSLLGVALLLVGCKSNNNSPGGTPVYFHWTDATQQA